MALLLTPGHRTMESPDTEALEHFLNTGEIGRDHHINDMYLPGADGRHYPSHELGADLVTLPIACIAKFAGGKFPFRRIFELELGFVAAFVFATTFVLAINLGIQLGVPPSFSLWHLLFLLVSSQYLVYGLHLADISLACPFFIWTAILWVRIEADPHIPKTWFLLGLSFGFLVLFKLSHLSLAPVLAFLAFRVMMRERSWLVPQVGAAITGALPAFILTGWWNWIRSGSPFRTLYIPAECDFIPRQFLRGLGGTLIGPGSSIFVYSPFLILAAPYLLKPSHVRLWNSVRILILGSLAVAIVRLSGMLVWSGVNGWGIRYYVAWVPVLAVLATVVWWQHQQSRLWRIAIWPLLVCGTLLNLAGTLANWQYLEAPCGLPEWMSRMPVCSVTSLGDNVGRLFGSQKPDLVVATASKELIFIANRLDVWWFAMRTQGVPQAFSWLVGLVLVVLLVLLAARIHASNRYSTPGGPVH
ncbi:MAG TPA: hypothetical protein VMT32_04775 [Bryobacteraceae bacterium]|nr:hypothetical protein [Bryobacteraceae bacterium]